MTRLLTVCGALRADSVNRKLLAEAVRVYGPVEAADADLRLPLYDGDLEEAEGVPEAVTRLADQIRAADGVLVSTPEYNQSLSGVLKNALDWVSRVPGGTPWRDKPVVLMSAAAGRAGGARGQYALRLAMAPFRPRLVNGPEVLLGAASSEFDAQGRLTGERTMKIVTEMMDALHAEIARG